MLHELIADIQSRFAALTNPQAALSDYARSSRTVSA